MKAVIKMAPCTSLSPLGSEFDNFLFAPIGKDRNGMLLSVVSVLARLEIDPWEEANGLARLPRDAAVRRLAAWIAALPDVQSTHLDPVRIASRLIALLPGQAHFDTPTYGTLPGVGDGPHSRALSYAIVIIMALILGAQCITASRQPVAPVDDIHAPAADTTFPQASPSSSGQ
jgi:hypothetical protein